MIVSSLSGLTAAQNRRIGSTRESVRIVRDQPSVFIEFVKIGFCHPSERTTVESWSPCMFEERKMNSESYEAVWLRIRNNSRWAINLDALSVYVSPKVDPYRVGGRWVTGIRNGAEVRLRYRVDGEIVWDWIETASGREYKLVDVKVPIVNRVSNNVSRVWLPPNSSAVFVVEREHLSKHLMVYIPYKYQWDGDQNDFVSKEPQHRVYFSWYSLQKAIGEVDAAQNKRLERTRR